MKQVISVLAVGLLLGATGQTLAADTPESLVKYRQAVMKAIGGHTGAIASVVKGETSYGPHVVHHARSIKEMSGLVTDIFPPESNYDNYNKTAALPEIWKEPAKFKQAVEAFQAAAVKLAEVAEGGDMQAIGGQLGELGKSCGGCHKPFRYEE